MSEDYPLTTPPPTEFVTTTTTPPPVTQVAVPGKLPDTGSPPWITPVTGLGIVLVVVGVGAWVTSRFRAMRVRFRGLDE